MEKGWTVLIILAVVVIAVVSSNNPGLRLAPDTLGSDLEQGERFPKDIPITECVDDIDNDRDGLIDRFDPGCWTNPNDEETYSPGRDDEGAATSQCQDRIDNDGDGDIDWPADPECSAAEDYTENFAEPTEYVPFVQINKLEAEEAFQNNEFGDFLMFYDDETLLISEPFRHTYEGRWGRVHVFKYNGNVWFQERIIEPSLLFGQQQFGRRLAVFEDTLVIGYADTVFGGGAPGRVAIYKETDGIFEEQQVISYSDRFSFYGADFDLYEDQMFVSVPLENDNDGNVIVYGYNGLQWIETDRIVQPTSAGNALLGTSISMDKDFALVGAPHTTHSGITRAGMAYLYEFNGVSWELKQQLVPSDPEEDHNFGSEVYIFGEWAFVAATNDDDNGVPQSGAIYAYKNTGGFWNLKQKIISSDPFDRQLFGSFITFGEDLLVVGAGKASPNEEPEAGAVYVFQNNGNDQWIEQQRITNEVFIREEEFGTAVAIRGDHLIAGAPENNGVWLSEGAAYSFERA